jgi:hypothetical protein
MVRKTQNIRLGSVLKPFVAVVVGTMVATGCMSVASPSIEDQFVSPPQDCRPWTWYHLLGNSISKEGVTRDMEAIHAAGIQGIHLFAMGTVPDLQKKWGGTPVKTLSPEWFDLLSHLRAECQRLGLKVVIMNCPGWGGTGGPWVPVEKGQRRLTWSEVQVDGGKALDLELPLPPLNTSYFPNPDDGVPPSRVQQADLRPVAVLAFPTPQGAGRVAPPEVVDTDGSKAFWNLAVDGKALMERRQNREPRGSYVTVKWDQPVSLRSLTLNIVEQGRSALTLETSDDGRNFRALGTWQMPEEGWRTHYVPVVLSLPETKAGYVRISWSSKHFKFASFFFENTPRLNFWPMLAGYNFPHLHGQALFNGDTAGAVIDPAQIIDISDRCDASGRLTWTPPAGRWTLLRVGSVFDGVVNKPTDREGSGPEADKMDPEAMRLHYTSYSGRITEAKGAVPAARYGGPATGILTESWESGYPNWTLRFPSEFKRLRSYDIHSWLPTLCGYIVKSPEATGLFYRDMRQTIGDLITDAMYKTLSEEAEAHGMGLWSEESFYTTLGGDPLRYYGLVRHPMSEFWYSAIRTDPKRCVSAVRMYNKEFAAAESFTHPTVHWGEDLPSTKVLADEKLAQGITQFVLHTYASNPLPESMAVPGSLLQGSVGFPFGRTQTWWRHMPAWSDYIARCQFLLRRGYSVGDVLCFVGEDMQSRKLSEGFGLPKGYEFEHINPELLQEHLEMRDGKIGVKGSAATYRVIVLRASTQMTVASLRKLDELIRGGAIVLGDKPLQSPGLSDSDAEVRKLSDGLWGDVSSPTGRRDVGKGRVYWGQTVAQVLAQESIKADFRVAGDSNAFPNWSHRVDGNTDIYFVANPDTQAKNFLAEFRVTGKQPELWDALHGRILPAPVWEEKDGYTRMPVRLDGQGSVFVVFRQSSGKAGLRCESIGINGSEVYGLSPASLQKDLSSQKVPIKNGIPASPIPPLELDKSGLIAWQPGKVTVTQAGGKPEEFPVPGVAEALPLNGPWTLSFPSGWDCPESIALPKLALWSEMEPQAVKHFSGTAAYRTRFTLGIAQAKADLFVVDLGNVAGVARVKVNGQPVENSLWTPPMRARGAAGLLRAGENVLEVEVTNVWRNRLLLDASLPENQRKTWTTCNPRTKELLPSGLAGPVTLMLGSKVPIPPQGRRLE